jgi:hypothetical protein
MDIRWPPHTLQIFSKCFMRSEHCIGIEGRPYFTTVNTTSQVKFSFHEGNFFLD